METLPVAIQCKIKALSAARSVNTSNELATVSDSGCFPWYQAQISKTSTKIFAMKFSLMVKKCHGICGMLLLGSFATLGWQCHPRSQHNSITSTAPFITRTLGEGSEGSPKFSGWRVPSSFPSLCIVMSKRHWQQPSLDSNLLILY